MALKRKNQTRRRPYRALSQVTKLPDTFRMSNRQYAALRVFADERANFVLGWHDALKIDQRSFGSIYHQGWITESQNGTGFSLTEAGRRAKEVYDATDVWKDHESSTFSTYIRVMKHMMAGAA